MYGPKNRPGGGVGGGGGDQDAVRKGGRRATNGGKINIREWVSLVAG